ncbi:CRISPR-associated protein Cas4 [Acidianus brierleyi]|jgi:CRISPR-associated exonuclease Cas4|uniref:CRISPR-associated exonuclease Cas4 n=1 Tax=Acidianus brierleyi TaxID=41673 RepID=A0A2U9IH98_9CREN|nr:CRISPR-associated protein Cas4 [Acidianus brierleyi]AWR95399.1 CRISPR-associated protein Cas4 [Acidianus brierleyi]
MSDKPLEPYKIADDVYVTGTLIWYLHICPREVWLMSRHIIPYQDNKRLEYGRAIHKIHSDETFLIMEGMRVDTYKKETGVVVEIKSSSKHLESAKAQLSYYLYRLREKGLNAVGVINVPEENIEETLENIDEGKVLEDIDNVKEIVKMEYPPKKVRIKFCRKCAYKDFCWPVGE